MCSAKQQLAKEILKRITSSRQQIELFFAQSTEMKTSEVNEEAVLSLFQMFMEKKGMLDKNRKENPEALDNGYKEMCLGLMFIGYKEIFGHTLQKILDEEG